MKSRAENGGGFPRLGEWTGFLDEKGIKYTEPAGNAGRVVIAPRDLEAFLMRHNTEQIWTSLSQHISFRYVVAPSLLASVLVLPKLFAFYANIPQ